MAKILDDLKVDYSIGIDEAAFYGPKLDVQYKNVYGKEDTLATIQIDLLLAKQFDMEYVDTDGQKKTPYIIHRTSLGCFERTLAYMIEKYAGAFPTWLAPTQVKLLPINDAVLDYTNGISEKLTSLGVRCEVDSRNEKIGYKIREAQLEKVPYMLVIGEKEKEAGVVAVVRERTATEVRCRLTHFDYRASRRNRFQGKITLYIKITEGNKILSVFFICIRAVSSGIQCCRLNPFRQPST